LTIKVTQTHQHLFYLLSEEYLANGAPPFIEYNSQMESNSEWVDLLDYLPNPSKNVVQKKTVGLYDIYALLPTYVVGFHFGRISVQLLEPVKVLNFTAKDQAFTNVLKIDLDNLNYIFEHHPPKRGKNSNKLTRGMIIKCFIHNILVSTSLSGTYTKRKDASDPTLSFRYESEITGRRRKKVKAGSIFSDLSDSSNQLLFAEKRRTALEQRFLWLKEFVESKKIFEKEGFSFYFGHFGMILNMNLFTVIISFFTSEASADAINKFEDLTKIKLTRAFIKPPTSKKDLFEPDDDEPSDNKGKEKDKSNKDDLEFVVINETTSKPMSELSIRERVQASVDRLSASIYVLELSLKNFERERFQKSQTEYSWMGKELERAELIGVSKHLAHLKTALEGAKKERDLLQFLAQESNH